MKLIVVCKTLDLYTYIQQDKHSHMFSVYDETRIDKHYWIHTQHNNKNKTIYNAHSAISARTRVCQFGVNERAAIA